MTEFKRPTEAIQLRDFFSPTECGLTHEFTPAYIRLGDNGDIELTAAEGLSIIMHPQNKGITFIADNIKFLTRDEDGLRWNKKAFNNRADKYTEPALVPFESDEMMDPYRGIDDYMIDQSGLLDRDENAESHDSWIVDGDINTTPRRKKIIDPETLEEFDGTETDFYKIYGRYPRYLNKGNEYG